MQYQPIYIHPVYNNDVKATTHINKNYHYLPLQSYHFVVPIKKMLCIQKYTLSRP